MDFQTTAPVPRPGWAAPSSPFLPIAPGLFYLQAQPRDVWMEPEEMHTLDNPAEEDALDDLVDCFKGSG